MIRLDNLSYSYRHGKQDAIDHATATIGPGIHLLLGENGAGKTTLLRLMAGLLTPAEGACLVDDHSVSERVPSLIQSIFFLPDNLELPTKSINEFAAVHSRYYPAYSEETLRYNLREFGLEGTEDVATLSLGMRHKTMLAYALALGVDVLLLDEPANGLDITSKKALRGMMARCVGEEQTVIISTHTVSDLRELYDGLIVLNHGRVILSRPSWEIASRISFIATPIPPAEKLFMDQEAGMFLSIVDNETGDPGDINYQLLYSALLSPEAGKILDILNHE